MTDAPPAGTPDSSRWLAISLHGFFLVLLTVSVIRAGSTAGAVAGVAMAAWYIAGVAIHSRRTPGLTAVWIIVLTVLWAVASVVISPDFVWIAFPLFFLYLFLLPIRVGFAGVAVITVVAIGALAVDDGLEIAEVVGPIAGAAVAAISAVSYRGLSEEHGRTQQLLSELEATRELLAETERERGALDERRRLVREVHDTVAQGLSSIILLTRAAELSPDEDPARMRQIGEIAQENLDEARRIVAALSPPDLDGNALPEAVQRVATTVADTTGIDVSFEVVGAAARIPVDHEVALLRVAQGALANAGAHAQAARVAVTITYLDDCTTLDVVDDGVGLDTDAPPSDAGSGYGLRVMRVRLDAVGGDLTIESSLGSGVAIRASVPRGGT